MIAIIMSCFQEKYFPKDGRSSNLSKSRGFPEGGTTFLAVYRRRFSCRRRILQFSWFQISWFSIDPEDGCHFKSRCQTKCPLKNTTEEGAPVTLTLHHCQTNSNFIYINITSKTKPSISSHFTNRNPFFNFSTLFFCSNCFFNCITKHFFLHKKYII